MKATHVARAECLVISTENNIFIHNVFHPLRRTTEIHSSFSFFRILSFCLKSVLTVARRRGKWNSVLARCWDFSLLRKSPDLFWGPPSPLSRDPFVRGKAVGAWNWFLSSVFCQGRMHGDFRPPTWHGAEALKTVSYLEGYDLLGCNAMKFVRSPPTFRRNVLSPSSWSKSKQSKKPAGGKQISLELFLQSVASMWERGLYVAAAIVRWKWVMVRGMGRGKNARQVGDCTSSFKTVHRCSAPHSTLRHQIWDFSLKSDLFWKVQIKAT
jgi:hypothetical protein